MKRTAAAAAGAVVAIGALGWGIPALAQGDEAPSESSSTAAAHPDRHGERSGEMREERRAELAERLAEELGLDQAEVESALEKVTEELRAEHLAERLSGLEERLASAVEDGRLTQEQADELLESAEEGDLRGGMRHLHRDLHGFGDESGPTV